MNTLTNLKGVLGVVKLNAGSPKLNEAIDKLIITKLITKCYFIKNILRTRCDGHKNHRQRCEVWL